MNTSITKPVLAALSGLLLTACGGGGSSSPGGGGTPVDPPTPPPPAAVGEKRLNTVTALDQQRPISAGNASGKAVVVWESYGQDGSHFGIFGRRLEQGQPVGEEFQANSYTVGRQSFPAVGMNSTGAYVVAWRSSLQGSPGGNIYAQRFAADGSRLGEEFLVGPDDSDLDSQSEPQVALAESGEFVIAFSNRELNELATQLGRNDLETRFVQLRIYNADGSPRTAPITATVSDTDGSPRFPRVGVDANGRIVLAWINGNQVRLRHFDLSGAALSEPYNVNLVGADRASDQPALAVRPDGSFAVAWETFTFGNVPLGVSLLRYSGPQTAVGPVQTVASPAAGLIERVSLTASASGAYLLAAQASDETRLAWVDGSGNQGGPLRFSNPQFPAMFPTIAQSTPGKATVAWQTLGQDGDGRGIYAREISLQ